MAEAPAEQREEVGPRHALDLTASASSTPEGGFSFSVSLKITNKWLAAGALAGIGLAALLYRHPELVTGAVRSALEGPGLQVGDIAPGSILVELHCNMKESLVSFVEDFKTKKVKQRLEQEFQEVGFEVELEVTITNDKEVYKKLDQIRQMESMLEIDKFHEETAAPIIMTEDGDESMYDVFICFSTKNDKWARELLSELGKRGLSCDINVMDYLHYVPHSFEAVLEAIDNSRKTILVLTPDFVDDDWCITFGLHYALWSALNRKSSHHIVPIVYKKCEIPLILAGRTYLDWENFESKSQFWDALHEVLVLPNESMIVSIPEIPALPYQGDDHSKGNLDYKYDVLISCSSKDINWVEQKLLHGLEECSYSCCVAFRDFIPGKPVIDNIVQAIHNSRTTVVVLSPDFVNSKFCSFELEMTLLNKERFHQVVPILYRKCEIPLVLQGRNYLDWESFHKRRDYFWEALETVLGLPARQSME